MIRDIKIQRFKKALAQVFVRLNLNHFLIERVLMSSDFRYAKIHIITIKENAKIENLNDNVKLISKTLQKYVSLKYWPKIYFLADSHAPRIKKITELMKQVEEETLADI